MNKIYKIYKIYKNITSENILSENRRIYHANMNIKINLSQPQQAK